MIRIPYPLPELDRLDLIERGQAAIKEGLRHSMESIEYRRAKDARDGFINDLAFRLGVEVPE